MAGEQSDIVSLFPDARGKPDVIGEAMSICRSYALSPQELFFKWEAYSMATSQVARASLEAGEETKGLIFDLSNLRDLRKEIQDDTMRSRSTHPVKMEHGSSIKPAKSRLGFEGILMETPISKRTRPSFGTPASVSSLKPSPGALTDTFLTPCKTTPSRSDFPTPISASKFDLRKGALSVVETLNNQLDSVTPPSSSSSRVSLASTADPRTYNYRYMFEKIMERSEALDNVIDEGAKVMRDTYPDLEEFSDPSITSQEDVVCFGRIQVDVEHSEQAKLDDGSLVLETSRYLGAGSRTSLRFENNLRIRGAGAGEGGVTLFPGILLALKGRNAGGGYFGVSEIIVMPHNDLPESSPAQLLRYQHSEKLAGQPLSVMTACGPYSADDNLDFAPFAALVDEATKSRPDVLILLGPFVDGHHPMIKTGNVSSLPHEIFRSQISSRLASLGERSPSTAIILVPSVRDLVSRHCAYPQSPLDRDPELGLPKRVKLLPNPAIFSINEVVFAVTSADSLFHLRSQQVFKAAIEVEDGGRNVTRPPKDAMASSCRHILRQRIFYPVFPSPVANNIDPVNLDVTHIDLLKMSDVGADVVILPSVLKHFVKIVDSAVVINPSHLTRGSSAGTFVKLAIHPMPKDELEKLVSDGQGDEMLDHRIWQRARVDIVRI